MRMSCKRAMHAVSTSGAVVLTSLLLTAPTSAGSVQLDGLSSAPTHTQFIVRFRDNSAPLAAPRALARSLKAAASGVTAGSGRALHLQPVRQLAVGPTVVRADQALDAVQTEQLMRRLAADPDVEHVEVDQILQPTGVPDDPRLREQWGFGTSKAAINVRPAWRKSTGSNVVVAVIDTGITRHPDLDANLLAGYDFISDAEAARDGDGRDADPSDEGDWTVAQQCVPWNTGTTSTWHGTHVTGTVAAVTDNATGVAGTAHDAKVVPVRVLGRCGGTLSDIADAIVWASGGSVSGVPANPHPAEVINLSLGGRGSCAATLQRAIDNAVARGTTVVVSAGNKSADVAGYLPANCAGVIAVAATTRTGAKAGFSNFGTGIDISAPGQTILSTLNAGVTLPREATYAAYNGTSMAAPHVAGVVALMQAVAPQPLSPAQVESIIKNTARALPGACTGGCGAGIVNADAAVDEAIASGKR